MAETPSWYYKASAILGAGNLISQMYTNSMNRAFTERQNALNRRMTWDMWNAENRYNHPAAQMQRLKAAGLNPALMYQDGSAGMPSATMNSPEQTAPQYRPVQLDPLTAANIDLAKSQAEKNRAEADNIEQKLPEEVNILRQTLDNMKKQSDEIQARIANMSFDNQVKAATAVSIDKTWRMNEREIDARIDEIRAATRHYGVLDDLTNREIWERTMSWSYRLAGLDLSNKEIASRVGLNQAMTNTEWFKQVNLQSLTNLNGLDYNNRVMDGVLKSFDINARAVENRANLTDLEVMENAFGAAIGYGLHVTGKIVSKLSPKLFGK